MERNVSNARVSSSKTVLRCPSQGVSSTPEQAASGKDAAAFAMKNLIFLTGNQWQQCACGAGDEQCGRERLSLSSPLCYGLTIHWYKTAGSPRGQNSLDKLSAPFHHCSTQASYWLKIQGIHS